MGPETAVNVLLVDALPPDRPGVGPLLEEMGHQVVKAESRAAALRQVRAHDFAVILLDTALPGLDVLDVAKAIRAKESTRLTPVIFLTTPPRAEEWILKTCMLDAVDCLPTPVSPEALRARIRFLATLHRSRRELKQAGTALRQAHDELETRLRKCTLRLQQTQAKLREETAARQRAGAALTDTDRTLHLFGACNSILVRATDEQALLDSICRLFVEEGGFRLAWVGYAENDPAKTIRPAARYGLDEVPLDKIKMTWADTARGHCVAGRAIRSGQPQIVRDIATDPDHVFCRAYVMQRVFAAVIALPLICHGQTLGVLVLCSTKPLTTGENETALLMKLADDLAFGLVTLRHRAEHNQAKEQLLLLNAALMAAPNSVVLTDEHGVIEWVNPAFTAMSGYSLAEAVGRTSRILSSGRHSDDYYAGLWRTIRGGDSWQGELVNRRKNGELYTEEVTIAPIRDSAGVIRHFVAIKFDITARKEAAESHRRLASIIENTIDLVAQTDAEGRLTYVNAAGLRMLGCAAFSEIEGRPLIAFHSSASADLIRRVGFPSALRDGAWEGETELVARNGRLIPVSHVIVAGRSADGTVTHSSAIMRDLTDRKLAEDTLRLSERRYQRVVENIGDGLMIDDVAGRVVFANDRFLDMFGLTRADLPGVILETYVAPSYRALLRDRHDRRMAGEDMPAFFEYEGLHRNGRHRWFEARVSPVIEEGTIIGSQTALRDITERRQTDLALRTISTEVAGLSDVALYELVARRLAELLGTKCGFVCRLMNRENVELEALAVCCDGRIVPNRRCMLSDTPGAEAVVQGMCIHPASVRERFPHDPLLAKWDITSYAAVALLDSTGNPVGLLGVMDTNPLSDPHQVESILKLFAVRTAAEIERQRHSRRFADLFEFAPDALVIADRTGVIRLLNRRTEKLFGWTRTDLLGQTLAKLLPDIESNRPTDTAHLFGVGLNGDYPEAVRKDGAVFPVEISISPMEFDEGMMIATAVRDVSERVKNEQMAMRSQRLESLGTLASGVAHDLNNALSPILMGLELLRKQYPAETDTIDMFSNSAQRGAEMVRQLLTFARGTEGTRVSVQISHLIKEIESMMKGSFPKNIQLKVDWGRTLPTILGDVTQLHQVLLNLCINARDAMPDGGTLTLEAACMDIDAAYATSMPEAKPGPYVALRVSDTGVGVPPEVIDKIFEPFFSTKSPDRGTGLGLATVMSIVKKHGGFVQVSSAHGLGSTFSVFLPVEPRSDEAQVVPPSHEVFLGQGETILFLDDEANIREVARNVLSNLNLTVLTAADGMDGLVQAVEHRTELRAIIADAHMPHMDGLTFIRMVRRMLPNIPIAVSSGRLDEDMEQEFGKLGVTLRLGKPFTKDRLEDTLRSMLASR